MQSRKTDVGPYLKTKMVVYVDFKSNADTCCTVTVFYDKQEDINDRLFSFERKVELKRKSNAKGTEYTYHNMDIQSAALAVIYHVCEGYVADTEKMGDGVAWVVREVLSESGIPQKQKPKLSVMYMISTNIPISPQVEEQTQFPIFKESRQIPARLHFLMDDKMAESVKSKLREGCITWKQIEDCHSKTIAFGMPFCPTMTALENIEIAETIVEHLKECYDEFDIYKGKTLGKLLEYFEKFGLKILVSVRK